ncbi:hypothetical protein Ae201684P_006158 [Aphanomyces euteiches]|uniref:OsmC-like protein n=1 Tax=Aphanomyces euteiches TaxID=100861 RepID=A0A6G0XAX3_9STRA|nr:hypothetical protein Ae201684_006437 [Aphanomyces euteiches]KAH9090752.1 hypothetical protein Ae201684P_006158 [Aphanomyces euteiches]KAH9146406.1 hypothetical protein AeRB84_009666 [Aphanomyces euteiches]
MLRLGRMQGLNVIRIQVEMQRAGWKIASGSRRFATKSTATYHLVGAGSGVKCTMQRNDGMTVSTDIPKAVGGTNTAPQPVEVFLSSLCGCELATAQFVARHMKPRMHIEKIEFDVRASRDNAGALQLPLGNPSQPLARLQRIWGEARVYTSGTQDDVDVLAKEVKLRCPIANMTVLSGCALEIEWKKAEDDN